MQYFFLYSAKWHSESKTVLHLQTNEILSNMIHISESSCSPDTQITCDILVHVLFKNKWKTGVLQLMMTVIFHAVHVH